MQTQNSKTQNSKILKSSSTKKSIPVNMETKLITFSLRYNSKLPGDEWKKDETKTYFINKHKWLRQTLQSLENKKQCKGIPCGKVNKIWVLDLDFYYKKTDKNPWIIENCEFTKTFGDINEYIKDNNIYCVKTISGGLHLYFSYDPEMTQTTCKELHIDTRSDGGYVVAPFSKIDSNLYTILNMGEIKPVPETLKSFVKEKVINKDKKVYKKITNKKIKIINPITQEEEEVDELEVDLSVYAFSFTDYIIDNICKSLPLKFFNDREYWVKFTTAMKTLDRQDKWLEWTEKRSYVNEEFEEYKPYDKDNGLWLITQWDYVGQHNKLFMVNHILNECKLKNARSMLDYYKYKPVPENTFEANEYIEHSKLGITPAGDNIIFFEEYDNRCIVVQSDTGTGKTTEFKNYILEDTEDRKFLSIVSRISLGKEQNEVFKKAGIDCMYHEEVSEICKEENLSWKCFEGENIVITIDSLMKTQNWEDYTGYTLFLDEFNSLIEYLITCPLLNKNRMSIYHLFSRLLRQCDRIICCDADINEISLQYLKLMDIDFYYMINEYKHNNNIPAKEIFSFNKFIKEVNKYDKWLVCCDSKTQAEIIAYIGDKQDYKLITSETTEHVNLDDHDRILYSPKIIYGLDSCMERPVFCYYKEQTISPVAMVQQICRCRNITKLYYLFSKKSWSVYNYHDYEQVYQEICDTNKYGNTEHGRIDNMTGLRMERKNENYVELLSKYIYRKDCYDTNKFAHFCKIIKDRGFKIETAFGQTSIKGLKEAAEVVKEIKLEDFIKCIDTYKDTIDTDNHKYDIIKEEDCLEVIEKSYPQWIILINELLKIDWDRFLDYKDLFMKSVFTLPDHFAICMFFNKTEDYIIYKLKEEKKDFECNKTTMIESKLLFIHKYRRLCGLTDILDINVKCSIPEDYINNFKKEYCLVFDRCAVKKFPDFKDIKHTQQFLVKMYNNCFGADIVKKRKSTKKGKSITYYNLNEEILDYHNEVLEYRQPKPEPEVELDFIED